MISIYYSLHDCNYIFSRKESIGECKDINMAPLSLLLIRHFETKNDSYIKIYLFTALGAVYSLSMI